jgi:DTW domain-containing protein YfiP
MRCLENSETLLLGRKGATRDDALPRLLPGYQPVLLFPDGVPLEQYFAGASSPVQLIVPDGSWRQGRKMAAFLGSHLRIPRVSLPLFGVNVYSRIRATKGGGASTLGAIASALGILEGVQIEQELLRVLDMFVSRVIASRCFHESPSESQAAGTLPGLLE